MTKIGRSASASGTTSDATTPLSEKSSGPITSSTVQPRSTLSPSGTSWSRQTTETSCSVRVTGVAGGPSLALVGHLAESGAVVTHLGDDGFAALRPLGGFDPHTMLGQRVDVLTREGAVPGVVAGRQQKRKRGEDRKPLDY